MTTKLFKQFTENFSNLRKYWKIDLFAGFWMLFTSFPLCICLAWASGFPFFSCILSLVVGSVIVGFVGGSEIIIKSSGVSMVVLVLLAVRQLSPYPDTGIQYTLVIILLAGIIQILLVISQLYKLLSFVSDAVVYGIVSALALWIFVHQFYYLLGTVPESVNFVNLIVEIPASILKTDWRILAIGLACLFVLLLPELLAWNEHRLVPSIFLVLVLGFGLSIYLGMKDWENGFFLVKPPTRFEDILVFPDFSKIWVLETWQYAFLIAIIGILDSLVNIRNVEVLDIYERKTHIHRELFAIGLGNLICGWIGGLPMIATMIKSTRLINIGARNYWAIFYQGVLILFFSLIFFSFFRYIPVVALAAILLHSTYRLNSPKLFRSIREIGVDQWIVFWVAFINTLLIGVWWGFLLGILTNFVIYWFLGSSLYYFLKAKVEIIKKGKNKIRLDIYGAALASNYWSIQRLLNQFAQEGRLILDFSNCKVVDYTFLEQIYYFAHINGLNDGRIELQGLKTHKPLSKYPLATLRKVKNIHSIKNAQHGLNDRQVDIQAIASVNNTTFEPNLTYDGIVLKGFKFALGYEIRYRENKFIKFYKNNPIEFSDVFLSKGLRLSEQSHKVSVLLVTIINVSIPDFSMTKEDIFSITWQRFGYEDINFEQYPLFSQTYNLVGEDTQKIRNFFKPSLIELIEQSNGYSIECQNNRLLIYMPHHLLNRIELEDCIDFTEQLVDLVELE